MRTIGLLLILLAWAGASARAAEPLWAPEISGLLKARCVKCHGPAKQEGKLKLNTPGGLLHGGENGVVLAPGQPEASPLWQKVAADEMPPEEPLTADEKALLKDWIAAGARGLPTLAEIAAAGSDHWAFSRLTRPAPPAVEAQQSVNDVDRFIVQKLSARGLSLNPEADRSTLIRRVSYDLTGLPPTPEEVRDFLADTSAEAYARMVEHYLASPHYGQRWGKYWLDAAGYADSNGYFNADSDRPLAYRYRDYVVRSINEDKPLDRFVLEQIAGDELSSFVPDQDASPEMISLLEATHYLRNAQDGSGESDGNAEEVAIDRYFALESTAQIVASSLLGLTLQCAKCHDHKFEPISQREYYQLQSVFYPAFNVKNWLKPNERFVYANLPGELAAWQRQTQEIDANIARLRSEFAAWVKEHRPSGSVLFQDSFDPAGPPLADAWSNTAPGDDHPAGATAVQLDSDQAPGAARRDGSLVIVESGQTGDRWLSTRQSFDWTPANKGQWIQVTFDLVDDKAAGSAAAERIGYLIALHDYDDNSPTAQGNLLVDGNPAGGASLHLDYPGGDSTPGPALGNSKYAPGRNYGLRITNLGDGKYQLEHLVDLVPDDKTATLAEADLPDGGFGFEYCCGRSFVVDNVLVEASGDGAADDALARATESLQAQRKQMLADIKAQEQQRTERPGKISCVTDRTAEAPEVFLQERGNHSTPGEKVAPGPLLALADPGDALDIRPVASGLPTTGRRSAWARWLFRPGSRSAALVARVQANRIWQHHFGAGIVATTENLGASGAEPSHPELLEYLASRLIDSGWSLKAMHRLLLASAVYRQSSALQPAAFAVDPENRLYWRRAITRLDAEALRDAMLATSGQLDRQIGGPYVPTTRNDQGEVLVPVATPGSNRRSLYLQQRRTQTLSLLNVFDSPTIVFNCVQRPNSTMPLQSLSLLNSEFVVVQARAFADRLAGEAAEPKARVERAFVLALSRPPSDQERQASLEFIGSQRAEYTAEAETRAWTDFCQMLLASNPFLYVE